LVDAKDQLPYLGLGLEYGDVPCGGTITGIGKVHGVDVMVSISICKIHSLY